MDGRLTPAMRRWAGRLEEGYTIRPRLRQGRDGYVTWGPALFNPEGAFVQNVRWDTFRQLQRLNILVDEGEASNG